MTSELVFIGRLLCHQGRKGYSKMKVELGYFFEVGFSIIGDIQDMKLLAH